MTVFVGTYPLKLDQKGRVSLPASFRAVLAAQDRHHEPHDDQPHKKISNKDSTASRSKPVAGERFFLFPSPTHAALEACSLSFMARVQQSIAATTTIFSQEENQISWLFAEARETQMDSTGRFVLPDDLLAFAQLPLGLPIYFVGYGNRFLIWNEVNVKEFKKTPNPTAQPQTHRPKRLVCYRPPCNHHFLICQSCVNRWPTT